MMSSTSKPVENNLPEKYALLVIDIQKGLFNKSTPIYKADQFLRNVNLLIKKARENDMPIVYIQHSNPKGLVYGSNDWRLHPDLHPSKNDDLIHKLQGNAFEGTPLHQLLQSKNVNQLVICGLVTHGCVKSTTIGALDLGYKVILVEDGHSSYSKDAADLITKWNNKLSDMGTELKETDKINFL